jgi:hypothetical protein
MKLQKIKETNEYLKDAESGAILSADVNALEAYKSRRMKQNELLNDINNIKTELAEIKDALYLLVSRNGE